MKSPSRDALIQRIHAHIRDLVMLKLSDFASIDLTMTQLRVVILLYERQRLRVNDIAAIFGVTSATVSGIIERLVQRGVVVREPDPEDRRAVNCRLSDKGRHLAESFISTQLNVTTMILDELSQDQLKVYDDLLATMTDIIKRKGRASADAAV